jgi:tRNA-2-methylthio-N6-dimethylallyladenosine synthase
MAKKFFIETFGCQMNELDSEKIAGSLSCEGMEPAADPSQADVIILNTCSVREKAVQKVYARLGEIKKHQFRKRDVLIGVVGCMAQLEGEKILDRAPFVNIIAGPQKGHMMPGLVDRAARTRTPAIDLRMDEDPEPLETTHVLRESPWRAGVTISEGCNRHCSFCIVPFTRGKEKDRPSTSVIREVEDLAGRGYVEVVLLGQTVNSYRDPSPQGMTFAGLLRRLAEIPGLMRLRFTSPHPNDFTDELLDVMISHPKVCDQIHLPVQSGSTRVLLAMRRGYTRDRYLDTIFKIRKSPRPIAISTDIIVGFPGETEPDFHDTLRLLDEVQYDNVFSFKYSPRPNTAALDLPGEVSEEEKGRRLRVLQEQQKMIQYNKNAAYLNQSMEVLVEDRARAKFSLAGRASNNKIVNFDGPEDLLGKFVEVKITGFSANSLKGNWVH